MRRPPNLPSFAGQIEKPDYRELERRVDRLEDQVDDLAGLGLVLFLYGAFAALWAQNTGRSAWLWFLLGLFFGPITIIGLLIKNLEKGQR